MKVNRHITVILAAILITAWPLVSLAHVHVDRSVPADGALLSESPQTVEVWFSGKVAAEWSKIEVTDSGGQRVDSGEVSNGGDPDHLSVALKPLPAGNYEVNLSVISGDGHRVKGSFSFSVK